MIISVSVFIVVIIELIFWALVIRWYRRRNKPVGDIIVTERSDGIPVLTFDFDNYKHPKETIVGQKKVVFKVVRAPYTSPDEEIVEDSS